MSPLAWKWPKAWPYNADYFSRKADASVPLNDGSPNLAPVYDEDAAAAIAAHYRRCVFSLFSSTTRPIPSFTPFSTHRVPYRTCHRHCHHAHARQSTHACHLPLYL